MPRKIGGMRVGQYVPEQVLKDHGIDNRADVETLVEASKKYDQTNKGYLSAAELSKGAEELRAQLQGAPTTTEAAGYRYSRRVLNDVKDEYLRGRPDVRYSDEQLVEAASKWGDGNDYLNRKELQAGAIELQMGQDGVVSAGDVAAIRTWTGVDRREPVTDTHAGGAAGAITGYTEIDGSPAERLAFLKQRFPGVDFEAMLDEANDVVYNRDGELRDPLSFAYVEPKGDDKFLVSVQGSFHYEDAEFGFYCDFEISGQDYSLVDAGAD